MKEQSEETAFAISQLKGWGFIAIGASLASLLVLASHVFLSLAVGVFGIILLYGAVRLFQRG